jgi:hypothetical protein
MGRSSGIELGIEGEGRGGGGERTGVRRGSMLIRDLDHMDGVVEVDVWWPREIRSASISRHADREERPRDRIVMTGWFIRPLVALFRDHDTGERDSTTI